jgi:hypothetical protein
MLPKLIEKMKNGLTIDKQFSESEKAIFYHSPSAQNEEMLSLLKGLLRLLRNSVNGGSLPEHIS